jgi:menaquinone-9 beta-reductase
VDSQINLLDEARRTGIPLPFPRGDTTGLPNDNDLDQIDVTVIGGGLAGMAAAIHLVRAGLRVLCVEADPAGTQPVGESLDWSAPELLAVLGLPMERLIDEGVATWKRHVILQLADGTAAHYIPGEWLGQPPFNIELRTLHVDRVQLNAAIRDIALRDGVRVLHDRVTDIETRGRSVITVITAQGMRIASRWFIDASGSSARLFPRKFDLPASDYGPHKVAIWTYFTVADSIEGTTLHAEGDCPSYMDWVWEIPIHPDTLSIGYVSTGDAIKSLRSAGHSVESIFHSQVARFPRFRELIQTSPAASPSVTSYRCRVHSHIFGPNWLVAGEAAAMVDPMTSNGVTAALRHASEAAALIIKYRDRARIPWLAAAMYSRRVQDLARFFNSGIEKVIYDGPIRNRIGVKTAGDVYTIPAWSLNNVYARVRPSGIVSSLLFGLLLGLFRAAASIFHSFCKYEQAPCEAAG